MAGLIPHGIGEAVRGNHEASKVLVLNGHNDRETGGFCARLRDHDMMKAISILTVLRGIISQISVLYLDLLYFIRKSDLFSWFLET